MADNMREILGDLLYTDPPDDEKTQMPSPELLKGKILVKAKRLPPGKGPEDELEEEDETDGVDDLDEKKKVKLTTCFDEFFNYESEIFFLKSKLYQI